MTDHIGEATQKVIDLDALEKLADEVEARSKSCASLVSENRDDETNARLQGKSQAYNHSAELVRAFLARNGKGEG